MAVRGAAAAAVVQLQMVVAEERPQFGTLLQVMAGRSLLPHSGEVFR